MDPGKPVADRCTFTAGARLKHPTPAQDHEANAVLGLNAPHLVRRRQSAVQGFQQALAAKKSGGFTKGFLQPQRDDLVRGETATPFEAAILFWLDKKLGQL